MLSKQTRIIAIIQARMGATRFPGKVLKDLVGQPMLARIVSRVRRAKALSEIVVATSTKPTDDVIACLCIKNSWQYFRGSEDDVLDRYYRAAVEHDADVVVRITSDNPLIEPEIMDKVIHEFLKQQPEVDYVSNNIPRSTYPLGLDTEVMRFNALERAWREDHNPAWREHVTPYIHRNPDKFRVHGVMNDIDYSYMRWTVDTPEDLEFVRHIYNYFGNDSFSWRDVIALLDKHPEWLEINKHIQQKVV